MRSTVTPRPHQWWIEFWSENTLHWSPNRWTACWSGIHKQLVAECQSSWFNHKFNVFFTLIAKYIITFMATYYLKNWHVIFVGDPAKINWSHSSKYWRFAKNQRQTHLDGFAKSSAIEYWIELLAKLIEFGADFPAAVICSVWSKRLRHQFIMLRKILPRSYQLL